MADYYLVHEDERKKIAKKGQEKVWKCHDLHNRMEQVMEVVIREENSRMKPYMTIQREWFCKKIDGFLNEGSNDSYNQLWKFLTNGKYENVIKKAKELLIVYEMINCWNIKKELNLFADIKSIKEAEHKYLRIKYGLWRIESGIKEDKCKEAVYQMYENQDSIFLIASIIKNNLKNYEKVFIITSQYMREYSMVKSIELLSYGTIFYPENKNIALQLANCFMEIGMWDRVLESLQKIIDPDEEIIELMKEIENVLGEK